MNELPDETTYRFVAVLNKKSELGRLFNALGHMAAGLVAAYSKENDFCFLEYRDADNGLHPSISHFPFIVLRADNSNQISTLRAKLIKRNLPYNDFTSTMTVGTSEEQQKSTRETPEMELEYLGICTFADTESLKLLTKKFQLYR
jgi:hypothetical protein